MSSDHPAIRVRNLGKKYRLGGPTEKYSTLRDTIVNSIRSPFRHWRSDESSDFWALKDVSFDVEQGEVVGIIGRNGAGKSTLLKILSRITTPTEGTVELYGRVGSLLEVGTGFHPELTGRENIFLSGSILGMKRREIEAKLDEIIKFSEIEKFVDTPVKRYSSGMYVRLAFAVAAHMDTEILLVDEVLAVGDAQFQKKCLGKMGDVAAKEGRTVLFVSHSMIAVQNLCENGLLLENGRIFGQGQISGVIEKYLRNPDFEDITARDISAFPRRKDEGIRFKYTFVSITMKNGILHMWDPLSITLKFLSQNGGTGICPGFGIYSLDGVCVFTCEGEDSGFIIDLKPAEVGQIIVTVPHPSLAPGRYFLRLGARSNQQMLDWVDNVLQFEISPLQSKSIWASRRTLGMRPQSEWSYG